LITAAIVCEALVNICAQPAVAIEARPAQTLVSDWSVYAVRIGVAIVEICRALIDPRNIWLGHSIGAPEIYGRRRVQNIGVEDATRRIDDTSIFRRRLTCVFESF
jgi:hypothetical protein